MASKVIIEGMGSLFYVTQGYESTTTLIGDVITQGYGTALFITQGYGVGITPPSGGYTGEFVPPRRVARSIVKM